MTVKQRVLALKILEKQKENPEYAKRAGINITITSKKHKTKKI